MAKKFEKIEELRTMMASLNSYLQFESGMRKDKSKVVVFDFDGRVEPG